EIATSLPNDARILARYREAKAAPLLGLGDLDGAILNWEEASRLHAINGEPWQSTNALNNIGFALAEFGNARTSHSEAWLTPAFARLSIMPQPHARAAIFDSIGRAYTLGGKYQEAETYFNKSEAVFARVRDKAQLVGTLIHRSILFERKHDWKAARNDALQALELATDTQLDHLCRKAQQRLDEIEIPRYRLVDSGGPFHGIAFTTAVIDAFISPLKT